METKSPALHTIEGGKNNNSHISFNVKTLRGEGELGLSYLEALKHTSVMGGVHHIEALIDPESGELVEFLMPDCRRIYEKAIELENGDLTSVPVPLSQKNPNAHHIYLLVDPMTRNIVSIAQRTFMELWAISDLHTAINEANRKEVAFAA